jgi:hypothetical protein
MLLLSCNDTTVGIPSLIHPINGEQVELPLTFIWSAAENSIRYRIEVDTTLQFSSPVIFVDVNDTTYTSTNLNIGMHYWRVAAYDDDNHIGEFTHPHSFQVFDSSLEPPDVSFVITDLGGMVHFSWSPITYADYYRVYADNILIDSTYSEDYEASIPAKKYGVTAFSAICGESEPCEINFEPVTTTNLDVWDTDEPTSPNGFGFNAEGNAVAYILSDTTNWPYVDYYIHGGTTTEFWSPHHGTFNDEVNCTKNSGGADFDALDIADPPGGYFSQMQVGSGAVYYFWIDPTDNGWDDVTDNFGKIKVVAIDGDKVTMKLAFQPIEGLRWCVTP